MSVNNGQKANETTFNEAFISRTKSTSLAGVLSLVNDLSESGPGVTNIQGQINEILSLLGSQSFPDANNRRYDADDENLFYIQNNQTLKIAIKAIDTALKALDSEVREIEALKSTKKDLLASQTAKDLEIAISSTLYHSAVINYVANMGSSFETGTYLISSNSGAWQGQYLSKSGDTDFELSCTDSNGNSLVSYDSGASSDGDFRYNIIKFGL